MNRLGRVGSLTATALALLLAVVACAPQVKVRPMPAGVRVGGQLSVGILSPQSIAPWLTSTLDPYGSLVVSTMCDQVLALDPATSALVPSIASAWRYQTGSDLFLKLRKGIVFPDGSAVSAADIADSLSRAARAEIGSPVADVVKLVQGWDFLQGLPTAKRQKSKFRQRLAGVRTSDPSSLEVRLTESRPDAFRFLAHPLASVIPSKAFRQDPHAMERQPQCVGPYRLDAPWRPGVASIELSRSPHYKATNFAFAGGGRGFFDHISFRIFPDAAALTSAYQHGQVDVAFVEGADAKSLRALGPDLVQAASPTVDYIGLPTNTAPYDRLALRIALSLAIDRRAVAASVDTRVRPLGQFLPPTLGDAYSDRSKLRCSFTAPEAGNVAAAKLLLSKAHIDLGGKTLRVVYNDEFDNRKVVQAVADQWQKNLGVTVKLVAQPWDHLLDLVTGTDGITDPFRESWRPEVSDPVDYLKPLFASNSIGKDNWSHFALIPFDDQVDKTADKNLDVKDRAGDLLTAENYLCLDMPMIPVAEGNLLYAVRMQRVTAVDDRFTDRSTGALLLRQMYAASP